MPVSVTFRFTSNNHISFYISVTFRFVGFIRQLQRFCVSIPVYQEKLLAPMGAVQINEGLYYLPDCSNYDEDTGLVFENQYLEKELIL